MTPVLPRVETALSAQIKEAAQRLGFELVGISPVQPAPHEQSFAAWLRQGFAGNLEYMQRTESLRRDPRELVPWAVSIISVGMNYDSGYSLPVESSEPRGWISPYALGAVYPNFITI